MGEWRDEWGMGQNGMREMARGWMDGHMADQECIWANGGMNGQVGGWMKGWVGGYADE